MRTLPFPTILSIVGSILSCKALSLIYIFFLSKGVSPANTSYFDPSLMDIFAPLASPLTAIANGWIAFYRVGERLPALQMGLLIACTAFVFFIFINSGLKDQYTRLVFFYYIVCCCIFIFLYFFDAHIDYDVRHQKFIAYLFFPILVTRLTAFFTFRKAAIGIALLCLISMMNEIRLINIWSRDTYLTAGDFRLSKKEFPEELYKMLDSRRNKGLVLFFSDRLPQWAIDRWDVVCLDTRRHLVYNGHKYPVWYIEREKPGWEREMKEVLPDYSISSSRRVGDYLLVELQ